MKSKKLKAQPLMQDESEIELEVTEANQDSVKKSLEALEIELQIGEVVASDDKTFTVVDKLENGKYHFKNKEEPYNSFIDSWPFKVVVGNIPGSEQ